MMWPPQTISFRGNSGRHYVSNPMIEGFTCYESSELKVKNLVGLVSKEEAYRDAENVPLTDETWEITTPDGTHHISCQEDGACGETTLTEIIENHISKHGFELVNIRKCTTLN